MSADEPRPVKYGMPASESQRVVDHHFVVMRERKRLEELHFQRALRVGPVLRAALDELALVQAGHEPVAVVAQAEPEPEPEPAPAPRVARRAVPDGLRERLGLR